MTAPTRTLPNVLCDSCVSVVQTARQEITLVGTAHISEDSAVLVQRVLRQVQPDTVMIELDASRAAKLLGAMGRTQTQNAAAGDTADRAPPTIGRLAGRVLRGDLQEAKADAVGVGLSSMYRQLDQMGFQSGAEFVVAVREADALNATLLLGDRDARQTLRRLSDALGTVLLAPAGTYGSGAPLPAALLEATSGANSELTRDSMAKTMEVLKQRDNVRALSAYMRSEVPPLYEALIAERDAFMANSLLGAEGQRLVAVVGLAHVDGIEAAILAEAGAHDARPRVCV